MKGPALPPSKYATLSDALAVAARSPSGLTFVDLREQERFLSWAEIWERAQGVAGALREAGVLPGDRVALMLPTSPDFIDAFFGTLLAGGVPVPLYPPVRLGRLEEFHASTGRMLLAVQATVVLTDPRIRRLLGQSIERARPRLGCLNVEELRDRKVGPHCSEASSTDLALIQFSSGSTVDPKPVALTHAQLLAQCAALNALMPLHDGVRETGVCWLPLYHDMGLVGCLLSAAYYPGNLVLIGPEDFLARPSLWLRAIARHQAYISPAPNFAYGVCNKRVRPVDLAGLDLSCWRHALCGAEPISATTLRQFAERFAPHGFRSEALMPVYGLSEATLAVTFTPRRALGTFLADPEQLASKGAARVPAGETAREIVSVGAPIPGTEVEIRGEDGTPLPPGLQGRLFVRGPSVMQCYFDVPGATARTLRSGWLDTGDLGFIHQGELYLTGRAKDLVIVRGANHAPQEFEDALADLPGIRAGCVVALGFTPTEESGEQLLMLVESERGRPPPVDLEEKIREAIAGKTGIRAHTVKVLAAGTLPRTSSGKLRRQEALRQFQTGTLIPPREVNALTLGWEVLRSAVALTRSRRSS